MKVSLVQNPRADILCVEYCEAFGVGDVIGANDQLVFEYRSWKRNRFEPRPLLATWICEKPTTR